MKLAEFEADGWQLDDGVRLHEEHPRTFWIPPSWRRYLLRPEQIVKLMFRISLEGEGGQGDEQVERMWVIVKRRSGWGRYEGILDNDPTCTRDLRAGLALAFEARHVIQIHRKD